MDINQNVALMYQVIGIILASAIVIFFSISFRFGLKYLHLIYKKKIDKYCWTSVMVTVVSLLWAAVFSYVLIMTILGNSPLAVDAFGALFIRPLIMITAVGSAITQKIRYLKVAGREK